MNELINYLNYSPSIFFRWENSEGWPVLYVSENVTSLFEASVEDFMNAKVVYSNLIHPDDIELVIKEVTEASDSHVNEFKHKPYRVKSKKGWIWVEDSTYIIRDTDGNVLEYYGYISDLTHLKNLELELEKANTDTAFLMKALNKSYLISKANPQGEITYVNDKFCELSGYNATELLGKTHSVISHQKTPVLTFQELWSTIVSKKIWHGVIRNKKKSEQSYYVDMTIQPILDEDENIVEFIAVGHEVTELVRKQLRLTKSLRESSLLKIPNRFALFETLEKSTNFTAAQIDIDSFHELNDFFGYETGDFVLKELVKTIESELPKSIKTYHIQADKFVLLSSDLNYEEFTLQCKELQAKIHKKSFVNDLNELSIRITLVTSNESSSLLARSLDMAHEYAKKNAKSYIQYSQECDYSEIYNKNLASLHRVKSAFKDDRIVPFYQAIYNNRKNRVDKYEVLARLIEKDGTVLSPYHFLDAIYKAKMNQRLTQVIITKSFEYFKDLPYDFSINLALSDMLNKELVLFILEQLQNFPEPGRIVFEILESEGIDNYSKVSEFISKVKAFGCKIAIDDFGSGYANFENLVKLDANFIKIDGSLIKELDVNNDAVDVIDSIGYFARKKGISTIGEFVSSKAIMTKVKELGIDYSQGYYIHEPSLTVKEIDNSKNNKLKSLIYVSKAIDTITYKNIQEILNTSYANNNNKNNIHGALMHKDNYFIQCIEGEIETIDNLFGKINKDARHRDIKVIGEKLIDTFNFNEWNLSGIPDSERVNNIFKKNLVGQGSSLYKAQYENMLTLLKELTKII